MTGTFSGLVFAMPTNYLMDNFGMKASLVLNGVFVIIGSLLMTYINTSFNFLIMGNLLAGIGRNVILSGGPKTSR